LLLGVRRHVVEAHVHAEGHAAQRVVVEARVLLAVRVVGGGGGRLHQHENIEVAQQNLPVGPAVFQDLRAPVRVEIDP
jgi:hypothetical protein